MQRPKRVLALTLAVVMLLGCVSVFPVSGFAAAGKNTARANAVSSEAAAQEADGLIVSFSKEVSDKKIEKIITAENAEVASVSEIGSMKLAAVSVEGNVAQTAEALADNSKVRAVQPNYRYSVCEEDPYIGNGITPYNQYQFDSTEAFEAWDLLESENHATTKVAVLDTGVDLYHEDLEQNLIRTDGKYARFAFGEQMMADDDVDEVDGHGTHVCGIIAADYNNGKGGSGIASGHNNDLVELMCVGASADGFNLFSIDIIKAIDYAVEQGARVINMSFGSGVRDLMMERVIQNAYYTKGVVFVAASGNEDYDGYSSPSDLKEVISVNASNRFDEPTYYSNYGTEKDILAPGNQIMSTLPGDTYGAMSGTSMASPVVAGIAALVLDANPDLTPWQVQNILCATAKREQGTLFESSYGFGLVNAAAAVEAAKQAKANTAAQEVVLKSEEITVQQGTTYGAEALVLPATSLARPKWSIADTEVATVNAETGVITALQVGETTITATVGEVSVSQKLTVEPVVMLEDFKLFGLPEDGVMGAGETLEAKVRLIPSNASFTDLYFVSSDESVVAATDSMLFARTPGSATITVENHDGTIRKTFDITVKNTPVKVAFTKTANWLFAAEHFTFCAKAYDAEGSSDVARGEIEYTSSNKKVIKIDEKTGEAVAVAPGKAYVTATNTYTGKMVAKQVTVAKTDYKGADYALKKTAAANTSITLAWSKVPVASGYQIDFKTATGSWKKLAVVSAKATSYKATKLKSGTVYAFRIRALYSKGGATKAFSYSKVIDGTTLADYKLKQSAKSRSSVTLKWNRIPSATGYRVQYKASKSAAWKVLKNVNAKTLRFKHTVKAGKTGYYRVCAYYKFGGAVHYFNYSTTVAARSAG